MRRQYILPNCTLTVEGLGDENLLNPQNDDSRPLLSTLMEVECQILGINQSLKGGKVFFDALLKEVNRYTQGLLSGVNHPHESENSQATIKIEPIAHKNLHRLMVQSSETAKEPIIWDLNTIQLFDLVETLDQLLADPQTLPNYTFELEPLSRRYRIAEQSLTRQAAPATLGIASLAVTGLAFFLFLPIPAEIKAPEGIKASNPLAEVKEDSEDSSEDKELLSPEEVKDILSTAPEIDSPTELDFIKRYLFRTINDVWQDRQQVQERLEFSVIVTKDGSIIDYEALDGTDGEKVAQTPLADLRYLPTRGGEVNKEAIAYFKVVFNNSVLEINPLHGYKGNPGFGKEITNKDELRNLTIKLRDKLRAEFKENQRFSATLQFRVGITADGEIGDYETLNQNAVNHEKETPLPSLLNLEAAGIVPGGTLVPQKPLGQFQVIFYPDGKLEVSPWRGYR
jgi:hypothetical protein